MKINAFDSKSTVSPLGASLGGPAAKKMSGTATETTSTVEPSAKVQLSSAATLSTATTETSFDQAKVDRIKAQIAAGEFKPDAGVIADKLIANAQEVLAGPAA